MDIKYFIKILIITNIFLLIITSYGEDVTLVDESCSGWKYLKGTIEPAENWNEFSFDEKSFSSGETPFYYGVDDLDGGTLLDDMTFKYSSIYMRKKFSVKHGVYSKLKLKAFSDDGYIIWINNTEVARFNMTDGDKKHNDTACVIVDSPVWKTYDLSKYCSLLNTDSDNLIAVHAFNIGIGTSPDFAINLKLTAEHDDDHTPPEINNFYPPCDSIIADGTLVTICFSEPVNGDIADILLCNGVHVDEVKNINNTQFIFRLPIQNKDGTIELSWDTEAKIYDLSPFQNQLIIPSAVWNYSIDTTRPQQTVRINEILASNGSGIKSSLGKRSDWIELFNQSENPVQLNGWSLSNSVKNQNPWQFPDNAIIDGYGFLIVYCDSETQESCIDGEYFTNFNLSKEGGYLALIQPDGTVVQEFEPSYPPQKRDISYGLGVFYPVPTPGTVNGVGFSGVVEEIVFSENRGYKNEPFELKLSTETEGASIFYTLNGTIPNTASIPYENPIRIDKITCLRAIALKKGYIDSPISTRTWLFADEVLSQPSTTPKGWPDSKVINKHRMTYGMNKTIIQNNRVEIHEAVTNIPSLSIVTDLNNLFDPELGVYVNPENDGQEWERPISLELIDPNGGDEFQTGAGIRIRGVTSRSPLNPKHSFRLFFRPEYGGKLKFPLFGDEGADEFSKIDLRTPSNYSWAFTFSPQCVYIRDTFSRDSQRDMDVPYTRSRFYHLYLNGVYWGIYQTQERAEADYAESYLGGTSQDWDCIKTSYPSYETKASDGNLDSFTQLYETAVIEGFSGIYSRNYNRIKGLDENGNRDPTLPVYLDEDNLIKYVLITYYMRDTDSPISVHSSFLNNMVTLYNRNNPDGFKWFKHDTECSMGANREYPANSDITGKGWDFNTLSQFNPIRLHQKLMDHPDYKMSWIDAVQKHLLDKDGALTLEKSLERWNKRQNEIYKSILMEAARWGQGYTRNTWLNECAYITYNFIPQSIPYLIDQLKARKWFPLIETPVFQSISKISSDKFSIHLSAASDVYYTRDGSDPRLPGGEINPLATLIQYEKFLDDYGQPKEYTLLANEWTLIKARAWNGGEWSALAEIDTTVHGDLHDLKVSELMYSSSLPEDAAEHGWSRDDYSWIELINTGQGLLSLEGVQFVSGIKYTFPPLDLLPMERVILVKNKEAFASQHQILNGMNIFSGYDGNFARKGEQITLAAPDGTVLFTFTYSNKWYPETDQGGHSLVVMDTSKEESFWSTPENWYPSQSINGSPCTNDGDTEKIAPKIKVQPVGQMVYLGDNTQLSVSAIGTPPLTYQWYKHHMPISGATNSIYTIDSVQESDADVYSVTVYNPINRAYSQSVYIYLKQIYAPEIQIQPEIKASLKGDSVSFRVLATGTAPLTYQWYKDDIVIDGATSEIYSIKNVTRADHGNYSVRVTSRGGSIQSVPAELVILDGRILTKYDKVLAIDSDSESSYPSNQSPYHGIDGDISTKYLNFGGYNSGFIITPVLGASKANAFNIITANDGEARDPASYQIYGTNDKILSSRNSHGTSESWTLLAEGSLSLPYTRCTENGIIYFPNDDFYTSYKVIFPLTKSNCGIMQLAEFQFYGVLYDDYPSIISQPEGSISLSGKKITLSVIVSGATPITYQWYKDDQPIDGAVSSEYEFIADSATVGNYYVVVKNHLGSQKSQTVPVRICDPSEYPVISYRYNNGILSISFSGRLYESEDMHQWRFLSESSPYETETTDTVKFYRTEKIFK